MDHISLITKVARLYHEQGVRQPEIAERLHLSQSRVSRLLKEAVELGIVRTVVMAPEGVHSALEDRIREKYGLSDVVIANTDDSDENLVTAGIGGAAASYLEATLSRDDRVGVSSWSSTLLATVDAMSQLSVRRAREVVQVLGGVGNPTAQVQATRLTDRFARVTGAEPKFFPAPGVVGSRAARDAILADPYLREIAGHWSDLTVVLAGIGSLTPSTLLAASGNVLADDDLASLRAAGAVGDVCLSFFDANGRSIDAGIHDRVVGISTENLRAVPRRIGVAGGSRKFAAIRAAVLGGWITVLITDLATARALAD